ncbi:MAG: membrane protein insertase YidC [Leptospirales bacterium]
MWKRLLPIALIVISFNLILYYFWGPQKHGQETVKGKESLAALSLPMVNDLYDRTLTITNGDVRWVLSLKTGQIAKWTLEHYHHTSNHQPLSLLSTKPGYSGMGLFSRDAGALVPLQPETILWNGSVASQATQAVPPSGGDILERFSVSGHPVTLKYHFSPEGYVVGAHLDNPGHVNIVFGSGVSFGVSGITQIYGMEFQGPVYRITKKFQEVKKDGTLFFDSAVKWVGNEDKYFIGYVAPRSSGISTEIRKGGPNSWFQLISKDDMDFKLFGEPKRYSLLKAQDKGLIDTIDFGWFMFGRILVISFIAKPIFLLMTFLYSIAHNYGIAIILVTILIKTIFFPLAYMSYKSIHEMQSLQPEIKKLQAKLKDDKAALNQALMELYKERRVNPLGGCLPMLVQIPVFVALYNILNNTVELRQAPFMLWIHDLSLKDPYYVLPIVMGITMILQYKLNPASPDPVQQKVMMFVPVVMTFFFLNFPAGLVLYWLVNNVLTIGQQYMTVNYLLKAKKA